MVIAKFSHYSHQASAITGFTWKQILLLSGIGVTTGIVLALTISLRVS